ncbi:MAG: A/G-specific adenine glycosylase [Deltaproteobacteria bacterium]
MDDGKRISDALLDWFDRNQRPLPWRRNYQPYHIWISEIMGQQTQMDRVVDYFQKWCARFPDPVSIVQASQEEIYKLWEGLGYYSRARNIQRTAEILCRSYDCSVPDRYEVLLSLPGIGPYTAAAIMSLAFNRAYPVIDANVERVFARLFDIPSPVKEPANRLFIEKKACSLMPSGQARSFNQALMELGALVCLPKRPRCGQCPINSYCEALQQETVDQRPVSNRPVKSVAIVMATGLLLHDGKIFIQKRLADDVWANLWEFPGGRLQKGETASEAVRREYREETGFEIEIVEDLGLVRHSYTIYKVTLNCYLCRLLSRDTAPPILTAAQEYRWVTWQELVEYAFPAGHRKLIANLAGRIDKKNFFNPTAINIDL